MFADFRFKFKQRLSNALLSGAFWVNNTASASTLLRLVGTYLPPPSGVSVTSDILQLLRTSVGSYRLYLYSERTDRGIFVDWTNSSQTLSAIASQLVLGTGAYGLVLDNSTVRLFGGTSNVAVDVNTGVTVLQIGNTSTAGYADVVTGSTELRGKTAGSTATTNITGGHLTLMSGAGASGSAGAANGGHVNLLGGQGYGTGTRGQVRLGYNGVDVGRVTVRNTILGLNGYTSTAADPTTTELPTAGDCGIHKNTTSGTVFLAFNDGGTIKKVALA